MRLYNDLKKPVRSQSGATLALVITLSVVLALLIVTFSYFSLSFGGSQEARNAVDAGALNVGKQVLGLKVEADPGSVDELQFEDVSDTKGKFGLTNINRVFAKALLVNLNVQAMSNEGGSSGEADQHADRIFSAAESLSKRLADKVKDAENLYPLFNQFSEQNSVRMLGTNASVVPAKDDKWQVSCVDRGAESNIEMFSSELPGNGQNAGIKTVKASDNSTRIAGYERVSLRNHNFNFVPFKVSERPHLIAAGFFQTNKPSVSPIAGWESPLPNAFATHGKSTNTVSHDCVSFVQTNPQRKFKLSIPHGFIRVTLNRNAVKYRVNGIPHPEADAEYGFAIPETSRNTFPDGLGAGTVSVNATLGAEYQPPTLFKAINALPGDHTSVTKALLQRCREIKPGCTESELNAALNSCTLQAGVSEYLIFPVGDDKAETQSISAAPSNAAASRAGWLKRTAKADGRESLIASEFTGPIAAPAPAPNIAVVTLAGAGVPVYLPSFVSELGEEYWTPGSGFDQCLGELRIERETTIDANGYTQPPAPL